MAGAISEVCVLFCSFSHSELVVRVTADATIAQVTFESDNPSESVQRALRDRTSTTQANAGIGLAEAVLARHNGKLQLSESDGTNAGLSFILRRS